MSKEKRTGLEIHFKDGMIEWFDLGEEGALLVQGCIFENLEGNTTLQNIYGQYVGFRNDFVEKTKTIGFREG